MRAVSGALIEHYSKAQNLASGSVFPFPECLLQQGYGLFDEFMHCGLVWTLNVKKIFQ
jgi:hypothetical protein